jgi:hypothetical protein
MDGQQELSFPQREAAFFYGLFLRGHSPDKIRRDIDVPRDVVVRWHRDAEREPADRDLYQRMLAYRKHVLAIFDSLLQQEDLVTQRIQ